MKKLSNLSAIIAFLAITALFLAACQEEIPVTSVTLNKTTATLSINGTETLKATIEPSDATNQGITWSSTDEGRVTVTQRGVITGKAEGSAVVYVTTDDGNKTAFCSVTVSSTSSTIPVTSVILNKNTLSLAVGNSETLIATIAPYNASNQSVSWSSSNSTVAAVSQSGAVSASSVGSTTITVTTADGNKTATCTVSVSASAVSVSSVSLNKPTASITAGSSERLIASITPSTATNQNLTWESSNTAVATVSASGDVTGVAAGIATIRVITDDGNKSATCTVSVSAMVPVSGVTFNKSILGLTPDGSEILVAFITPATATNLAISWESSNLAVATVSGSGLVRGVSVGTAVITVRTADGGKTATCTVSVTAEFTISVSIIGDPQVGRTLTADVQKNFSGVISYQWYRNDAAIEYGTGKECRLWPEDAGKAIKVRVTCDGKSAESSPVNVPNVTYTVTVSTYHDDLHLQALFSIGVGFFYISDDFACQWYRDNTPIPGATSTIYALTSADSGKAIKIIVTGNGQTFESDPYNVPASSSVEFVNATIRPDEYSEQN
jgi:uncharacterized protein YjdB